MAHAIASSSTASISPAIVSVVSVAGTCPIARRASQTHDGGALAP